MHAKAEYLSHFDIFEHASSWGNNRHRQSISCKLAFL